MVALGSPTVLLLRCLLPLMAWELLGREYLVVLTLQDYRLGTRHLRVTLWATKFRLYQIPLEQFCWRKNPIRMKLRAMYGLVLAWGRILLHRDSRRVSKC